MYHTVWTNGNPDSPKSSAINPLAYIKHVWFQTEFRIVEHVGCHRKNGPLVAMNHRCLALICALIWLQAQDAEMEWSTLQGLQDFC